MSDFFQELDKPIYVLSTQYQDKTAGCVITWVTKATLSLNPQRIIFTCSKFNETFSLLNSSQKFTLNLLSENQLQEFFIFGTKTSREMDKFAPFNCRETSLGPVLSDGVGFIQGTIMSQLETPDRVIFYGEVNHEEFGFGLPLTLRQALQGMNPEQKATLQEKMDHDSFRDESILRAHPL